MSSSSQVPDISKGPGPSNLRIVRVKRKRNLEAPDDLVIQDLAPKKKKPNETLTDALSGLGLAGDTDTPPATRIRPKRYRKLITMTAAEMLQMGPEKLQKMLTTTNITTTEPAPTPEQKNAATTTSRKRQSDAIEGSGGGSGGGGMNNDRYEQIRRRRGLTNFEVTESAVDPLRGVASVHDVVRISTEQPNTAKGQGSGGGSGGKKNQMTAEDENTLLCNYLPMVREYLDEEQNKQNSTTSQTENSTVLNDGEAMDTSGDGYVYDLNIEAVQQYPYNSSNSTGEGTDNKTQPGNEDEDEDAWWDMYLRGGAPVVQIIDDDTWLVVEASDEEDSDVSSEDSNAEDYYGNDYPDEEEDSEGGGGGGGGGFYFSSSDEDGGGGRIMDSDRFGAGGGGSRRRKEWFDESDESE